MILAPGDVVLTRGMSVPAKLIRVGTKEPAERQKSRVNHAGIIVCGGGVNKARIVESLDSGTVERPLSAYRTVEADSATVYRLQPITDDQRAAVAHIARSYVGRDYGWAMVAAHAADWLIGSRWFFRGMIPASANPVCSGVVAIAYAAIGYRFRAIPPHTVQPDDIWDDVTNNVPPWLPMGVL